MQKIKTAGDRRLVRRMQAEVLRLATDDEGMSTAEYAIGTVAAAAFGALLYTVVTGDSITSALRRCWAASRATVCASH